MHWTIYSFFTDIATIRRQREMALPLPRKREVPVTKVKLLRSRMIRKRSRPVLKPSEGGDPFAQVNPKKSGKKRPLGISSGDDKLVQEVVRIILERIYEPIFDDNSHGFRPGRSPHTALEQIGQEWTAVKWFVDMDIRDYFNTIPHDLLMELVKKKIEDKRFLCLIQAMLDAGYLEDWRYHATYSGVPQGSICAPILANVLLHELDTFVSTMKRG